MKQGVWSEPVSAGFPIMQENSIVRAICLERTNRRDVYKQNRSAALAEWRQLAA